MRAVSKRRPTLVKRYGGNRLYDTTNRRYVSVDQLREWAAKGMAFSVVEAESGKDITRMLLA
jgi:polyhydroxyalkanoate synthesis regulator protein